MAAYILLVYCIIGLDSCLQAARNRLKTLCSLPYCTLSVHHILAVVSWFSYPTPYLDIRVMITLPYTIFNNCVMITLLYTIFQHLCHDYPILHYILASVP